MEGFVTALVKVAHPVVPSIESLGVNTVQMGHERGQVDIRGFDDKVVMIVHQYPGMANDLVQFDGFRQDPQEKPPILVVTDDLLPFVPTARYVIQGIFIKDPFGSCHGLILKGNGISVKCTM
jgi:hypothetical protein